MDKLGFILDHFDDERVYKNNGYYRVKQLEDDTYELEFSIAGSCGTFDSHPAIRFKILPDLDQLIFLSYRDVEVNPMKWFKPESDDELDFVTLAFEQLVDKFYQFK